MTHEPADDLPSWIRRIETERDKQGVEAALRLCDAAIHACGRVAALLRERSYLRHRLGDYVGALNDADEVVRLDPCPYFLMERARRHIRLDDYASARNDLTAALEHPNEREREYCRSHVELLLAYATMQLGDIEEGIELARRCSDPGPLWIDGGLITRQWMIDEGERILAEEREADEAEARNARRDPPEDDAS